MNASPTAAGSAPAGTGRAAPNTMVTRGRRHGRQSRKPPRPCAPLRCARVRAPALRSCPPARATHTRPGADAARRGGGRLGPGEQRPGQREADARQRVALRLRDRAHPAVQVHPERSVERVRMVRDDDGAALGQAPCTRMRQAWRTTTRASAQKTTPPKCSPSRRTAANRAPAAASTTMATMTPRVPATVYSVGAATSCCQRADLQGPRTPPRSPREGRRPLQLRLRRDVPDGGAGPEHGQAGGRHRAAREQPRAADGGQRQAGRGTRAALHGDGARGGTGAERGEQQAVAVRGSEQRRRHAGADREQHHDRDDAERRGHDRVAPGAGRRHPAQSGGRGHGRRSHARLDVQRRGRAHDGCHGEVAGGGHHERRERADAERRGGDEPADGQHRVGRNSGRGVQRRVAAGMDAGGDRRLPGGGGDRRGQLDDEQRRDEHGDGRRDRHGHDRGGAGDIGGDERPPDAEHAGPWRHQGAEDDRGEDLRGGHERDREHRPVGDAADDRDERREGHPVGERTDRGRGHDAAGERLAQHGAHGGLPCRRHGRAPAKATVARQGGGGVGDVPQRSPGWAPRGLRVSGCCAPRPSATAGGGWRAGACAAPRRRVSRPS